MNFLLQRYDEQINPPSISVNTENNAIFAAHFGKSRIIRRENRRRKELFSMEPREKLDATDLSILRALQQNARLTLKELAAAVNLSTTPVFERLKRLEASGCIRKYVAVLDAEKLGRGFTVFCSVKMHRLNKEIASEFTRTIRDIPEVTECYNISGSYDYLLKIHAPDMKYYQAFVLDVLGSIAHLGSVESTFVMDEIKLNYGVQI